MCFRNPYTRLLSAYKLIALQDEGYLAKRHKDPCKTFNKPPLPALTFTQFIQCIMDRAKDGKRIAPRLGFGGTLNFLWRPQTLLCNFCAIDYNIVGHQEHMNEDIIEALHRTDIREGGTIVRENESDRTGVGQLPLSYWYSRLSSQLIHDIQTLYARDFELLGYSNKVPKYQ